MISRLVILIAALRLGTLSAQSAGSFVGADMIVFNATITTQSLAIPRASAVAVKRGRIYAVGSDAEILSLKDNTTKLIDAHGRRLIPGLMDAHVHILNERNYNYEVKWEGVPTLKIALQMLSEQAKRTPQGQWVKVIGGWSPYQFAERRHPTIEELKKAVPDRPFIVQYAYNVAFLNEPAMKALGVGTDRFPKFAGTVFEKDSQGRYTGVVRANTFTLVTLESRVPQPSYEEQVNGLAYIINLENRFGVTSVIDAGAAQGYPDGHQPLQDLARQNRLNVRFPFIDLQFGGSMELVDAEINAITRSPVSPRENLLPGVTHGHEYEGAGEMLRLSLHDHENFDRPAIVIDRDSMVQYITEDVTKLVKRRIPFRMHLSYNENITPFLDALERVNAQTPLDGLRWSIEHAETITPENIERVKRLGGGIALDGKMAMHGDAFVKTYSREKALRTPALRRLVESGIPLAMTSDGYRAGSINPWIAISWTVSGKSVSGSEILATDNRLTREEALKLWTTGAAWFANDENDSGKIEPGYLADFALLSADYFTVPEDQIANISSALTVVDGRVVFGNGEYSDLAPKPPEVIPAWSPVKYFGGYYNLK